jgi:hypothetical protein
LNKPMSAETNRLTKEDNHLAVWASDAGSAPESDGRSLGFGGPAGLASGRGWRTATEVRPIASRRGHFARQWEEDGPWRRHLPMVLDFGRRLTHEAQCGGDQEDGDRLDERQPSQHVAACRQVGGEIHH